MLLGFWLLLSGEIDVQTVGVGVAVAAGTVLISRNLLPAPVNPSDQSSRNAGMAVATWLRILPLVAFFVLKMVYALVLANIQVALIVLNPRLPISPQWFHYQPPVRAGWARTMLANSVTLTPGTLTVELSPSEFLVHALTADAGPGLVGWSAERQVARIEQVVDGATRT